MFYLLSLSQLDANEDKTMKITFFEEMRIMVLSATAKCPWWIFYAHECITWDEKKMLLFGWSSVKAINYVSFLAFQMADYVCHKIIFPQLIVSEFVSALTDY